MLRQIGMSLLLTMHGKSLRYLRTGNTLTSIDLPEYEARPDAFNDTAWQWLDTASG